MARSEEKAAKANIGTGQSLERGLFGQSQGTLSSLAPQFQAEALHPTGFNPADLAKMHTGAQQSAGGAVAGAVGQGNLMAARTRNAGAFQPAIGAAVGEAGRTLGQEGLGIDKSNAMLKEQQRQEGLKGMMGLYDTQQSGAFQGLGLSNQAINAGTNASQATTGEWMPFLSSAVGGLTQRKY